MAQVVWDFDQCISSMGEDDGQFHRDFNKGIITEFEETLTTVT